MIGISCGAWQKRFKKPICRLFSGQCLGCCGISVVSEGYDLSTMELASNLEIRQYSSENVELCRQNRSGAFMLIDNGERLIINQNWLPETIMEHLHRYQFAREQVREHDVVLDAACGTGYGSGILAEKAGKVYGIDISEDAVQYASERYSAENISFQTMSVEKLEFPDNFFDVVVSFETIEHVEHEIQKKFLAEIKRCLKPKGILIMSMPNDDLYRFLSGDQYDNPFHVADLTQEGFKKILREQFRHIAFYYQNVIKTSSIFREGTDSAVTSGRCETPVYEDGRYYVAICGNEELKALPGNHVYIPDIAAYYKNEFFSRIGFLVADIGSGWDGHYSVQARSCGDDHANFSYSFLLKDMQAPTIQALRFDPCYTSCRVTIKRAIADGNPCRIHQLNASATLYGEDFFYTPNPMYQIEAEDISGIQSITIQGSIEEIPLTDAWYKLEASIHDRDQLQIERDRLQAECGRLQAGHDDLAEQLAQSRNETMKVLTESERSLSQLTSTLLLREMAYRDRVSENKALAQLLSESQGQATEWRNAYQGILSSRSWRITRPLRDVSRVLKKLLGKTRPPVVLPAPEPRNSSQGPYRILLVSHFCPSRSHAGGLRILDLYRHIKNDFVNVELTLFTVRRENVDWGYDELDNIFDFVYFTPYEDLSLHRFCELGGGSVWYDVVDFQFVAAAHDLDSYRRICGRILLTPMELMTEALFDEIKNSAVQDRKQWLLHLDWAMMELKAARGADCCVCVSKPDAEFLTGLIDPAKIVALETCLSETEFPVLRQKTFVRAQKAVTGHTLLYVAFFDSRTNQEALRWFLMEVHPIIKQTIPDYRIDLVGRGDISVFNDLHDENTNFIGAVDSLESYIQDASAAIAPAFFGSGFRGKINQYAIYGVPCVATVLAARGLSYVENESILVTDDPLKYAEYCIALLSDQELNRRIGEAARSVCMSNYSWASKQDLIASVYGLCVKESVASKQ